MLYLNGLLKVFIAECLFNLCRNGHYINFDKINVTFSILLITRIATEPPTNILPTGFDSNLSHLFASNNTIEYYV